jgi:serine/threonine-protein kinase
VADPRVQNLLDNLLDTNATPEEVCRDCPELLAEVRVRWRRLTALQCQIDKLFPPESGPDSCRLTAELPKIPGYEVEMVLGHGGVGVVYKARHLRLNRLVALKMLLVGPYAVRQERERFLLEAEAVAGLRHPNVVQVYDSGELDGRPYFTMEFVEGGTLAKKLAGTPLAARVAAELVAALADAVRAAHAAGIIHRDLKPANILLQKAESGRMKHESAKSIGTGQKNAGASSDSSFIPKVADFGLARRIEGEAGLTRTGVAMGTPSYMAPEQVRGDWKAVGPVTDVYALGVILYECLTGRPPFRAETSVATLQQVLADEPAPPRRLNPTVPRDLETICLKCLEKDPHRRYTSAAALADDLGRFLRCEPILARPEGRLARLRKWVRRHPTHTSILGCSVLLALVLAGVGVWQALQQADRRRALEADLKDVTAHQQQARWVDARAALDRAEARLNGGDPDEWRRRLEKSRRDLELVIQLDAIRLKRVTHGELRIYQTQAARRYAEVFHQARLGQVHDPSRNVASAVNASAVRPALMAALDDWSSCSTDKAERDWLLEVANQADPDAQGWRARVSAVWDDARALADLARTIPVERVSMSLLLAIGERLKSIREFSVPFLKRVQREYPADFWANLMLGDTLFQTEHVEAAGYYRAALASRPGEAVGYCVVGDALRLRNDLTGAIDYYNKALTLAPNYVRTQNNLGLALQAQGHLDEAMVCYQKALELDPDYAWAHYDLGNVLDLKGRLNEAYNHYKQVLRLDPTIWEVQAPIRSVQLRLRRDPVTVDGWQTAIDANPRLHAAWSGYPELCLFLGLHEEYLRARRDMLVQFGETTDQHIAEPVSRSCLLLPAPEEVVRQANDLADRALATQGVTPKWICRYFHFAKGLAEYRQNHFASAIKIMEGEASKVMGASPRLIVAMAQYRQGQEKLARQTLAKAILSFDWSLAHADRRDTWICHILRREAESLILPNLPAFLDAHYQPQDNDERLALLGICQFKNRTWTSARLCADAIAADQKLASDLGSGLRYRGARAAALAGCGRGDDVSGLTDAEKAGLRAQARQWLQADLAAWGKELERIPASRDRIRQTLLRWQNEPDLAGLRDPANLDKLSAGERQDCLALWTAVASTLKGIDGAK